MMCLLGLILLGGFNRAAAQERPLQGVVWEVPPSLPQAMDDLIRMRRAGVEAVRTGIVRNRRLLSLADTLGLRLFQELPVAYLPAEALRDTLAQVRRNLSEMLGRARSHPSARYFGVARFSDTSDPAACAYVEQLARQVHEQGPAGSRVYYVTPFVEDDRCAGAADLVLLSVRDAEEPQQVLTRWQRRSGAADDTGAPVGIADLGTWVRGAAGRGLRVPHSEEAQARYLETHLRHLLAGGAGTAPAVVFVERWRDVVAPFPALGQDLEDPYRRAFGLFTRQGAARPAYAVVRGMYTGRQRVHAFSTGTLPPPETPWLLLLGWGVIALLGGFYALSPRFRQMIPRYFKAHGFFRDAVREGREVLLGASTVLLTALSFGTGLLGAVFIEVVRREEAVALLMQWLARPAQEAVAALVATPWMLVVLLASVYALALALWTSILSFISRRHYPLMPGQALMLVVWPRWPLLLLMVGTLAASTLPHDRALLVVLGLGALWALISVYGILRTLYDYAAVTRVPFHLVVVMGLSHPLLVGGVMAFFWALEYLPRIHFFWHLAVRT